MSSDIRTSLIESGAPEVDVDVAGTLEGYIHQVDSLIFPGDELPIELIVQRRDGDPIASYQSSTSVGGERYRIFIEDLQARVSGLALAPLLDEAGNFLEDQNTTYEEALISVAVHEVRHRIQYLPSTKMWDRGSSYDGQNELVRQVLRVLADTAFDDKEFDSHVIDAVVLQVVHRRTVSSWEEVALLLRLQPKA